jgi:hypothetical protein
MLITVRNEPNSDVKGVFNMIWIQCVDLALQHEFELQGSPSTIIKVTGDIETAKRKLRLIFGERVKIITFDDMED